MTQPLTLPTSYWATTLADHTLNCFFGLHNRCAGNDSDNSDSSSLYDKDDNASDASSFRVGVAAQPSALGVAAQPPGGGPPAVGAAAQLHLPVVGAAAASQTPNVGRSASLTTDSQYPVHVMQGLVDALPSQPKARLVEMARGRRPLRVGTFCSGTDNVMWALEGMFSVLSASREISHVAACEHDSKKQEFILQNHKPHHLFVDMEELANNNLQGLDRITQCQRRLPQMDLIVCGFSCKDLSRLNCSRKDKSTIIKDSTGTSGNTFSALTKILQARPPRWVITENVDTLTDLNTSRASNFAQAGRVWGEGLQIGVMAATRACGMCSILERQGCACHGGVQL